MAGLIGWLLIVQTLGVPLDVLPPATRAPVYPSQGNGFAATIVGAFVVLGVLALVMVWVSRKPKNRRRS